MEGENHISERDDVVIRFSGDSGDGMQMTGKLFTDTAALMGNGISTFPDFPAEIRAPQGTVSGVSGFQVHIGDHPVSTPGDYCDVLVAMNPAALRANARWLKPGATIICDGDTFNDRSVERAGFRTFDPVTEMNLQDYNVVFPHMTSMTQEYVRAGHLLLYLQSSAGPCRRFHSPQVREKAGRRRGERAGAQGRI